MKTTVLSMFAVFSAFVAAAIQDDLSVPVRPGNSAKGIPFWNGCARFFRYAPAFDFPPVPGAMRYRFTLTRQNAPLREGGGGGAAGGSCTFLADSPEAPLSPVWADLSNGEWRVVCEGLDADGTAVGPAGEREFVKTAPFSAAGLSPAARPYRESARMIYGYMTSLPAMRTLVETGVPEQGYQHNAYPSKTHAAHINAMLDWAKADTSNRETAMRFARASGDYLLSQLEPPDAPLAFWPPTYGRKPLECDPAANGGKNRPGMVGNDPEGAAKYRGQVMTLYPADVGAAFVRLSAATGEAKYLDAARGIGETYLRLRRADGTWPLKYRLATGAVECPNPLVPTHPMAFFEALADATGEARWRAAADDCFAWLEKGPLSDWNWDGQFEDIEPRPPYQDLTKHNAIDAMLHLLKRHGGDPAARAAAREILRWSEDQFAFWEPPCAPDAKLPLPGASAGRFSPGRWHYPSVFEQYSCYSAIDASAAKMIRAYLAMWRAEGDPIDLAKARALADSITQVQEPSGRVPTFWMETGHWIADARYDWLNCMAASAAALVEVADTCDAVVPAAVTSRGGLSFGGAEIDIVAYAPGWKRLPVKAEWISAPEIGHGRFTVRDESGATLFQGRGVWSQGDGESVTGRIEISCFAPTEIQCLAVAANVPAEPPFGLGDSSADSFDLPLADGRTARLAFPRPMRCHAQDSRPWGGKWSVRFGDSVFGPRACTPGDTFAWDMTLSAPGGLALQLAHPITIAEGDDWVRLDFRKDVEPGSALDFSDQRLQDAPAGKHGWLKAVDGHFEFEGLPGVEQRFYGVNLCFSANYPDHDVADRLVDRLVRSGYNALRVHHHDGIWKNAFDARCAGGEGNGDAASGRVHASGEGTEAGACTPAASGGGVPQCDDIDRLDYLLAKCFERGIYATTDLYVSRKAPWRDIGIDRDGTLNQNLYKTYVSIHDGTFADWCRWSRTFLEHVNPYTGRAYKDEPGLPLISLINEGILAMGWESTGKATDPFVRTAWEEYGGEGATPSPDSKDFARFDEWVQRRTYERCAAFVRSLGCRALLTNDNNGRLHGEGEGTTPLFDYVDSHFYVDHPTFIDKPWSLPSKCGNDNLIKADKPAIFHRGWAKDASKPYTISEWNIAHPGVYRGMGGILTGALAAEQEWDGLWRFAYSHSRDNLVGGQNCSGFFDCVADPLIAASDRASVCLFLRGDAGGAASRSAGHLARPEAAPPGNTALVLDKGRGSMAVVTPRTCGGFAESGGIEAGPLRFMVADAEVRMEADNSSLVTRHSSLRGGDSIATTLWASSLDGEPLERSRRILLVHLTDVQGEGAQFADKARRILLQWGKAPLVRTGAADVELRLSPEGGAGATPPTVWALDTAGRRIGAIPARVENGILRFRVCTAGPRGGCIYYEIAM